MTLFAIASILVTLCRATTTGGVARPLLGVPGCGVDGREGVSLLRKSSRRQSSTSLSKVGKETHRS